MNIKILTEQDTHYVAHSHIWLWDIVIIFLVCSVSFWLLKLYSPE